MFKTIATTFVCAALATGAMTVGAFAGQPTPVEARDLFQPVPVVWYHTAFRTTASAASPWGTKFAANSSSAPGDYFGVLSASQFAFRADSLPRLPNEYPFGASLLRLDAGRSYNDLASTVTDYAQSPDAPDFRPLFRSKHKRSALPMPYLGVAFTTPTTVTGH